MNLVSIVKDDLDLGISKSFVSSTVILILNLMRQLPVILHLPTFMNVVVSGPNPFTSSRSSTTLIPPVCGAVLERYRDGQYTFTPSPTPKYVWESISRLLASQLTTARQAPGGKTF